MHCTAILPPAEIGHGLWEEERKCGFVNWVGYLRCEGLGSGTAELPQWLLPGGFKCEFGGGNRGAEDKRKHAGTQIASWMQKIVLISLEGGHGQTSL